MAAGRITNAEVKAGLFLTFCIGLFVAMLFVYGKVSRSWRGRRTIEVVFTDVTSLNRDAVVHYNGLEVGKVRKMDLVELDDALLMRLPPVSRDKLEDLPLTEDERLALRDLPAETFAEATHDLLRGRSMVRLELDLLAEEDEKRFRVDDKIAVTSTLMSEATVEIISGSGAPLPSDGSQLVLGSSGDMFADLSNSLAQVKNILGSVAEMVGGGDKLSPLGQKLQNFDAFTGRMDRMAGVMEEKFPGLWDKMDENLELFEYHGHEMPKRINNLKDTAITYLDKTEKDIQEVKKKVAETTNEGSEKIRALRNRIMGELDMIKLVVKENKSKVPAAVREAREWTQAIDDRVTQIEQTMTRADNEMRQGAESTRQSFVSMSRMANGLEEKMWFLANYPWALTNPPRGRHAQHLDADWRRDLMRRHFTEIRDELDRARAGIKSADEADRARVARITQILQQMDTYLSPAADAPPAPAPKR